MKKMIKTAAAGAAAVALVFMAGPALASGNTYDVSVNGSTAAGTHAIEAYTITNVQFSVDSSVTGNPVNMGCDDGYVSPTSGSFVRSGTNIVDLAQIDELELTGCVAAGGVPVNVTIDNGLLLHGTTTATSAKTDTIGGHIEGIHAEVRSVIPGLCDFDADGAVDASYNEAADELAVEEDSYDGSLTVDLLGGCLGSFADGDAANFEATFVVEDGSGNPINVNVLP